MGPIVTVHSYRGGTGKSTVTANLAWRAASRGLRVAAVDTDLQAPALHHFLSLAQTRLTHTLADYLFGRCELEETAYDMTRALGLEDSGGALYLLPSALSAEAILRALDGGHDVTKLGDHLRTLAHTFDLDIVFVDTHPGLNRETLLTASLSRTLLILVRPDEQDFLGTRVLVQVARHLGIPNIRALPNKVGTRLDRARVERRVRDATGYPVVSMLPFVREMMQLGRGGVFAARHPAHPFAVALDDVVDALERDLAAEDVACGTRLPA